MDKKLLQGLIHFPRFWYISIPSWWWRFFRRLMLHLDNQLAVRVMIRFWLVPVWQDTTIIGRTLSLIFRTFRVVLGGAIILAAALASVFWLLLWLLIPVTLLILQPAYLTFLLLVWVLDAAFEIIVRFRDPVDKAIIQAQADPNKLMQELYKNPQVKPILDLIEQNKLPEKPIPADMETVLSQARKVKLETGDGELRLQHLFLALLKQVKFHYKQALQAFLWLRKKAKWRHTPWIWEDDYPVRPIGGINRAWTGIITPELDKVSTDLTKLAAKGKITELIGRQEPLKEIVRTLGKKGRENVLIIGEPGTGKTTLVENLANEIVRGTEFKGLEFKRLIDLDVAALTSGSMGKVRERVVKIIDEILVAGNVILFIDELHSLVSAQESQASSVVFTALEPHLDQGEFQFIATTTPGGYKRFIEPSGAFSRTFRNLYLEETNPEQTLEILQWKAYALENKHNLTISFKALESAAELARRYIHDRFLPDSAIDLLEETAEKAAKQKKPVVSRDLEEMVTERTKIPVKAAESQKEKELLLNLEKDLHKRVVGQDEAIENLADALRRARTGFAEEGRLLASFLFAGATGVGKTETAKALAQVYFGSEKAMIRIDMSEYQTQDSIYRLIGPPPGKPGYELGGQLTESVRRRPFTAILLDEIEKANPRIVDVFLQLLDDARLTDGAGRTVDFSNTIVIATSNIGTKTLIAGSEKGEEFEKLKTKILDEIKQNFRPEFLNRFTGIVVYQPLDKAQVKEIAHLQLKRLQAKMKAKEIKLEFSDQLVDYLADKGYNKTWGARELRRVIRDRVEKNIAKKILQGEIVSGEKYLLTPEFLGL